MKDGDEGMGLHLLKFSLFSHLVLSLFVRRFVASFPS